jgi:beta-glucosidase/6-phospho-beta-glucosidase/beta-galactosidase
MPFQSEDARRPRFEFLTGFEGTYIFGSGLDVLQTTEHTLRYEDDLRGLAADGIRSFRACIPWHRIEAQRGAYDWTWLDGYLGTVKRLGLDPIVDPLHHTSFPDWLAGGFADPAFEDTYLAFLEAFARRYPWVRRYTIINEPLVTAWFCGHCAIWQPKHAGHENFVPMILAVCRTICRATEMLDGLVDGAAFVHVDSCERHHALDEASLHHAWFENERRFLVLDLITGRLGTSHPLRPYLTAHGATDESLAWFEAHPARIDILGLDYYSHSELAWREGGALREKRHEVQGFAATALEYVRRYELPVMLSETNLRGAVEDRISWLKHMVQECEELQRAVEPLGVPFLGFCWYPYVDSTDWTSLVREARRDIDPQGVISLDPSFGRRRSELSELYAGLAGGALQASDLPAYAFSDEALGERMVANFLRRMPWAPAPEEALPLTA